MSERDTFREVMRQRRQWPKGSGDYEYRTRAARKLVWMIRKVPTTEWADRMKEFEK